MTRRWLLPLIAKSLIILSACGGGPPPTTKALLGCRNFDLSIWEGTGDVGTDGHPPTTMVDLRFTQEIVFLGTQPPDWSIVKYVVVDEPFWFGDVNNPPADLNQRRTNLENALAAVKSAHPGIRTWVNFSEPEVLWWQQGYQINGSWDVISLDRYKGLSGWSQTESELNFLLSHKNTGQLIGLIPEGFTNGSESVHEVATMQLAYLAWAMQHNESVAIFAPWVWDNFIYNSNVWVGMHGNKEAQTDIETFKQSHQKCAN